MLLEAKRRGPRIGAAIANLLSEEAEDDDATVVMALGDYGDEHPLPGGNISSKEEQQLPRQDNHCYRFRL